LLLLIVFSWLQEGSGRIFTYREELGFPAGKDAQVGNYTCILLVDGV